MCDNAMVYNRPETVYYKAAKKLLHTGFKMMSKVMRSHGKNQTHFVHLHHPSLTETLPVVLNFQFGHLLIIHFKGNVSLHIGVLTST